MHFIKLEATGNDFIVIDARNDDREWSQLARQMCHRHFGAGADGLILVMPSSIADFEMKIINSDGSEAEVCGNGLRCFAKYIIDNNISSKSQLTVSTQSGIKAIQATVSEGKVKLVKVNMGRPYFKAKDIPVIIDASKKEFSEVDGIPIIDYPLSIQGCNLSVSFVSMGNPHAISFLTEPVNIFPLIEIGPKVEDHDIFPQRINFEIAQIINREKIEARVWERGVGETLACGSGACAITVIAKLKGYIDNKVDIMLPGGILTIDWDGEGEIYLTGPVEEVFEGTWLKTKGIFTVCQQ